MATFIEKMKELEPDTMVYVGAEAGAGWLVIEKAGYLAEHSDIVDKALNESAYKLLEEYKKRLAFLFNDAIPKLEKRIMKIKNNPSDDPMEFYKQEKKLEEIKGHLEFRAEQARTAQRRSKELTDYLESYPPFADREVVNCYIHKNEVYGLCVIVKGDEAGKYWFKEEYDER